MKTTQAGLQRTLLVCAHASASSGRQWNAIAKALGPRHSVHAPDLSGGDGGSLLGDDVGLLSDAIAAAGAEPIHLVGHSYGGVVALLAALRHPDRVASLVVYEPVAFWLLRDDARGAGAGASASAAGWREVSMLARGIAIDMAAGHGPDAARDFIDYWSGKGAWASLPGMVQMRIAERMASVLTNFVDIGAESTPLAAFGRLPMPVMWLGGEASRRPGLRVGELLGSALPQMVRYTLPGLGHMGPVTHPGLVASLIAGFVGAQGRRRSVRDLRRAA